MDESRKRLLEKIIDKRLDRLRLDNPSDWKALGSRYFPKRADVSNRIVDRMKAAGAELVLDYDLTGFHQSLVNNYLKKLDKNILAAADMEKKNPGSGIHKLGKGPLAKGFQDFFNCDLLEEILHEHSFKIHDDGSYLDFGCSSGRTLRTFHAAFPDANWYGVDPIGETVNWARRTFPDIHFSVSNQSPPLGQFEDGQFDGVYAKSIWSHFGKDQAIIWAKEMARIVKSGGFFLFTAPGFHCLAQRVAGEALDVKKGKTFQLPLLEKMTDDMLEGGFSFVPLGKKHLYLDDVSGWGTTHLDRGWVEKHMLKDNFELLGVGIARSASFQDFYLCKRL